MKRSFSSAVLFFAAAGLLAAQTLSVDKTTLTFSAQSNGQAVTQTINVTSNAASVPFFVNSSASWLKTNPVTGATPSAVTVSADPAGLNPGVYTGTLAVLGGQGTAPSVQVTFNIGTIGVTPSSLTFVYQQGGPFPSAQGVGLSGQTTSFSAIASTTTGGSWLQVNPAAGSSPGTIAVTINSTVLSGLAAGTYTGKITITPTTGPVLVPIEVPISLIVSAAPVVTVTPSTVNINYQIGGLNNSPQQTVTLGATGTQPVTFSFSNATNDPNPQAKNWVTFNPGAGTIPAGGTTTAAIGYNETAPQLPAGNWNGSVTLNSTGQPQQIPIPIKLFISTAPLLNVPSATVAFNYQVGAAVPGAKTVTATSTAVLPSSATGQMTITLAATSTGNWLTLPSNTGVTGTPFSITVNPSGLTPGNYTGTVTVTGTGAGNGAQSIPVTLTVANDPQVTASVGGCNTLAQSCPLSFPVQLAQIPPQPQTIRVASSTGATLSYTVTRSTSTCNSTWLVLGGATNGSTEGLFTVSVDSSGLAAGSKCDGTVTITATNPVTNASAPNSPVTIPVTMYVSSTALFSVNPLALNFSAQVQQGSAVPFQTITVNSTSPTEQIAFNVTSETFSGGSSWLIPGPPSGSTASGSNVISVFIQPGLLSAGTYTGRVRITATSGSVANSPIDIPVTLTVTGSNMSVSPTTLSFAQTAGGAVPAAQPVTVSSSTGSISWTATVSTGGTGSWLSISSANGTATAGSPSTVNITTSAAGLSPGTYNGTITFNSITANTGGSPATVNVTFVVSPGTLAATPLTFSFAQVQGGPAPSTQSIAVTGTPASLSFTASASTTNGSGWLAVSPSGGSTPGTVTVSVNGASLSPATYSGTVRIASTGATGSPIDIPVTLTVTAPQSVTATPSSLTFNHTIGNQPPATQTVQLNASGGVAPFTITTSVSTGPSWLTVTPSSGSTPTTLTVSANPAGLAAGNYTGTISVLSPVSTTPVATTISVNLVVIATVPPGITAVRNAASYSVGGISAGENIAIFGSNLGPAVLVQAQLTTAGRFPTTVGETQVTFDGIAAPMLYAWGPQTSVMVPYEIAGRVTVTMRVIYKGVQSDALQLTVTPAAPGIYTLNQTGGGPGAILNQDFGLNAAATPAAKTSVVQVYMTGEGVTSPVPANGALAPLDGSGLYKPILPVTAAVGGIPARVLYYGSAPGIVYGVMQVNVEIPANAPSGAAVPIQILVGTTATQVGVTVAVQ